MKAGQARLVDVIVGFIDPERARCHRAAAEPDQDGARRGRREKSDDDEEGEDGADERRRSRRHRARIRRRPPRASPRIAKCYAHVLAGDREARRARPEDAEGAQEARRRVHGAEALAAHVRCADPQPAHPRRRSPPAREGDHGHRRARCRHAAQGLHRHLPEERDQPALARQAHQGGQEVLRAAREVQGRDRAPAEEARARSRRCTTSRSTTSRKSTARCRSARPRRAARRRRWSRPTCAS